MLHGFGGTRRAWDGVIAHLDLQRYRPLALDLPGHGEASAYGDPITFEACVEAVLAASPDRFALCGYSMGGRIALHVALAAPARVSRLILVASSPGIGDPTERAQRRTKDRLLADQLQHGPFDLFIEHWRTQPLFRKDPFNVDALAREDQRRNDPRSLAKALRGVGTGEMDSLWDRLDELEMRVGVVVGERDEKFRALGERMHAMLKNGTLLVIPGGHVLPLENPTGLVGAIGWPQS